MRYFPLFADLAQAQVLVVGGGEQAAQKVRLLRKTAAHITVVAEAVTDELRELGQQSAIWIVPRAFLPRDLDGQRLVYAATGDRAARRRRRRARRRCAASPSTSSMRPRSPPSSCRPSSTAIPSPWRSARKAPHPCWRARSSPCSRRCFPPISARLPGAPRACATPSPGPSPTRAPAAACGSGCCRVPSDAPSSAARRTRPAASSPPSSMARRGRPDLRASLTTGRVALIGCGPGDPDLLTLKAVQRLQEADVLVVDRLVNPKVLEYARRDAERIFVGKTPRGPTTSQAEINRILVREAAGRQDRGPAQGRRPLHLRPRRRGDGRLPGGRHRRRGGAGHHGRACLRRAHRPARDAARARAALRRRHRRHRRGRARPRLAGARRRGRRVRGLHGRRQRAAAAPQSAGRRRRLPTRRW